MKKIQSEYFPGEIDSILFKGKDEFSQKKIMLTKLNLIEKKNEEILFKILRDWREEEKP